MKAYQKRTAALVMSVLLAAAPLAGGLSAWAAEADTVHITKVEDLRTLAKRCASNTYSQGLRVVLDRDLDLSGFANITIPVFCGEFDGQHHKITGFTSMGKGSDRGLFRYIEAGAQVHSLTLEGTLEPEGTKSGLGLLAGRNEGTIRSCAVAGSVTGEESVGGLVGVNEATGVIRDCVSRVTVTASTNAGGIAGRSEGTIHGCVNEGAINPDGDRTGTNTGGVTGRSEGVITDCVNRGTIGYQHVGYNTGGIVGIQNGSVTGCRNEGRVYGRKDVGGIVGQFEPYIDLKYGASPMDTLDQALDQLSVLLGQLADQVSGAAGDAIDDFKAMNNSLSSIRDTVHGAGTDFINDTEGMLTDVHSATQTVNGTLDTLLGETGDFIDQTSDTLEKIGKQLKKVRKNLMEVPNTIGGTATSAVEAVDDTIRTVENALSTVKSELSGAKDDMKRLKTFVKEVADILASGSPDADALQDALDRLGDIDPAGRVNRALSAVADAKESIGLLGDNLHWGISQSRDQIQASLSDANDALARMEKLASTLNADTRAFSDNALSMLRTVNTQAGRIENTVRAYAHTTGQKGQTTMDAVNSDLKDLNDTVGKFADGASATNTDLHGTTRAIIAQLNNVEDAIYDLTKTPEKTVDDISDTAGESGPGRVYNCRNTGAIEADANVGGIAGMIAPELEIDPEEDIDLSADNVLVDTTAFVKATLRDCRSDGSITAKNECAGGILGRAELGAAIGCMARGTIETTGGGKAGGIAGLSDGLIQRCAAQVDLTGEDNLGGIAGQGSDIIDCRAMTRIDSNGEKLGAIAGAASGQVSANYFLDEDWAGVDGINFAGQSEPVPFETFRTLSGVPEDFLTFAVDFVANGETIAHLPVTYGGSLPADAIPQAPQINGEYGTWETFEAEDVRRSQTVHALYSSLRATIASPGAHPALLAEGAFSPEATIDVLDWTPDDSQLPSGYRLVSAHSYGIRDGGSVSEPVQLRAYAGEEGRAVAVLRDGRLVLVDSTLDGSYLLFESGADGAYAVLRRDLTLLYIGLGAGGVLLLAGLVLVLIRRRKRRAGQREAAAPEIGQAAPEDAEQQTEAGAGEQAGTPAP